MKFDVETLYLLGGVIILLFLSTIIGLIFKRIKFQGKDHSVINNLLSRIKAWWIMCAVFAIAMLSGGLGSIILFGLVSFLALREFITIIPTKRADHRALFWLFFIIVPLQYYLIHVEWYGFFILMIPVYAFLFVPIRMVVAGDCEDFLSRTAKIQWGLMACVFCISHVPAILKLQIPNYDQQNGKLLFFFVLTVQISDVMQYVWGKMIGKKKIVPTVSPNKTWEGFIGGILTASLIGTGLWWATPFTYIQAFGISVLITCLGFCGDITMSAIKRDANIKDYGTLIQGHGGMLDRIDSLCFAAPVFFHVVRYYFT